MEYRELGKTGMKVSRIGFGGIPIQRITKAEAPALVDAMLENGINYIDTARAYTVSEEWLGYALKGRRDRFVLATKSVARSADAMRADIETSLHKLQTDHIDLYQVHNPSMEQLDTVLGSGGALEALTEAKKSGKIGHIGITAHSEAVFRRALELDVFETIMFPYNIVEQQGKDLIPKCRENGIGFICMKPFAGGAIDDGTLALRYILQNSAVDCVIPGMENPEQVRSNAACGSSPLKAEEEKKIEGIRDRLGGHFCRRCNYCAPCTQGISIPSVFLFLGYLERYGLKDWAMQRYSGLKVKASACVGCGKCEPRCPYHLPIREMIKEAAKKFEG